MRRAAAGRALELSRDRDPARPVHPRLRLQKRRAQGAVPALVPPGRNRDAALARPAGEDPGARAGLRRHRRALPARRGHRLPARRGGRLETGGGKGPSHPPPQRGVDRDLRLLLDRRARGSGGLPGAARPRLSRPLRQPHGGAGGGLGAARRRAPGEARRRPRGVLQLPGGRRGADQGRALRALPLPVHPAGERGDDRGDPGRLPAQPAAGELLADPQDRGHGGQALLPRAAGDRGADGRGGTATASRRRSGSGSHGSSSSRLARGARRGQRRPRLRRPDDPLPDASNRAGHRHAARRGVHDRARHRPRQLRARRQAGAHQEPSAVQRRAEPRGAAPDPPGAGARHGRAGAQARRGRDPAERRPPPLRRAADRAAGGQDLPVEPAGPGPGRGSRGGAARPGGALPERKPAGDPLPAAVHPSHPPPQRERGHLRARRRLSRRGQLDRGPGAGQRAGLQPEGRRPVRRALHLGGGRARAAGRRSRQRGLHA